MRIRSRVAAVLFVLAVLAPLAAAAASAAEVKAAPLDVTYYYLPG